MNDIHEVTNAFTSVRPRGPDVPAPVALPPANTRGLAPPALPGSLTRVMDSNGNLRATLAPRVLGSIAVEGQAQGQASQNKRHALVKGGL